MRRLKRIRRIRRIKRIAASLISILIIIFLFAANYSKDTTDPMDATYAKCMAVQYFKENNPDVQRVMYAGVGIENDAYEITIDYVEDNEIQSRHYTIKDNTIEENDSTS